MELSKKEQTEKELSEKYIAQVKESLRRLENWVKEGKDRNDAKVKDMEEKICIALDVPSESWIKTGQTLKGVIENLHKHLDIVQKVTSSSEMISDKDVLKNASGSLALEGVYKTGNPVDLLMKREQLIEIPDSFSLNSPKQCTRYEQKEFSSHKSERHFHKVMEKLGYSFSSEFSIGFKGFSFGSGVQKKEFSETEETSSNSQEESYILHTKYNYIPLASGFFQKDGLKLSTGAINALKEIEKVILYSNDCRQTSKVGGFFERYGSHVNQGPLHFGGVFWWRASASGFRSTDLSEVKKLTSESLDAYCGAGFGFGTLSVSGKVATSSTQLKGSFTGKYREDLMSQVQLSVSKTGGPAEIDDYLPWKTHLAIKNRTWSLIDRGTNLVPVWEIVLASHRDDFEDVSNLSRILMEAYTDITKENVEEVRGENILLEEEKAETLIQSVKGWIATDCEILLTKLLNFKNSLFEKTGSHKIWFRKCLSNEILQNYLLEVATANSKSEAVNLRILTSSLLEPYLYNTVENFPNRKTIVKWAYQTEGDSHDQVSVSEYSDLSRILQSVKKELEESNHAFRSAEQEHSANIKATKTVALSLKSFCKTLGENDQKETELLVLSIITVLGYTRENRTFNHALCMNEIIFLQSELQKAFNMLPSLKEQCSIRAQAYLLHTALTVSTNAYIIISPKEKRERLEFIQTQLKSKLSSHIESVIEKNRDDWESLESALHSIIMGKQMRDGSTTVEESVSQLESILMKPLAILSEVQTTDEHNTSVMDKSENTSNFMDLLLKLGLQDSYPKKMTKSNVLVTDRLSLSVKEPTTEKDLSSLYLYKLMTLDYRARYLFVKPEATILNFEVDCANPENDDDFFDVDDKSEIVLSSRQAQVHPMDVHMAIFHCSNDFLRQYIFTKLSACQFSLPFLVPNPYTGEVEFPLWALRHIRKSWHSKIQGVSDTCGKYHNRQMFNTPVPIVSFIRLGVSDSNSKSQILNCVISKQRHDMFFHRHCKGSTPDSLLMQGVVEIAWYCPGGKEDDVFDDCVAFLNLHGDAAEYPKQLEFLQAISTVNVLLLSEHPLSKTAKEVSQKLSKSSVPLICLFSSADRLQQSNNPTKVKLAAKNRNQAKLTEELISSIKHCLTGNKQTVSIEGCCEEARKQQFIIDEDKQSCKDGYALAQTLMCLLKDVNLSNLKERILPLQGKLWHDWCKKDKEQYRLQSKENEGIEEQLSKISAERTNIRKGQLHAATPLNDFMRSFLECLTIPSQFEDTHLYTLQWLRVLLDDLTTDKLGWLEEDYHSTWRKMTSVPKDKGKASVVNSLQTKLDRITDEMAATTVGLQHIMREVGQLYEAVQMCMQDGKNIEQYVTLPKIGVTMLLSGYPLEIMDGDAAHVPLTWIKAVLDELIKSLGDKKVFVLSILGIQSSGKSTLLNTMFGLQFAVSAGRCTRGAFMQLVEVDSSIRNDLGYDFVLIVDTEGLRSPEFSVKTSLNHDNELATFIIGIGDTTVINIMGENPSEMHDILQICVQAFLRMKQVKITPSCIFVHQNVAESSAGDKNVEGRRRLLEKLDDMAQMAAKEENIDDISCFSDVIHFDIETQVFYFKSLLEGDPPMAPPNPSYSQNVQDLKIKLLRAASMQRKCTFSSLSEFKCRVSDLWTALLKENFVFSFKNTVEMMVYSSLENKYGDWSWNLRKYSLSLQAELENQIGSNLIQNVIAADLMGKYDKVYDPLRTEIEKYFTEDKNKETLIKWKANIDKRFESLKDELIDGTIKKCQELLTSKRNRSELDKRKTQYTDELTQQSKRLASTLKDMHLRDEQVMEKFDELWIDWTSQVLNSQPKPKPLNVKAIVESVLLKWFHKQPGIQDKIKRGLFQFDPKKHIQQNTLKMLGDLMFGSPFSRSIEVFKSNVVSAIDEYITAKENKKDFDENFIYEILSNIETKVLAFEGRSKSPKFTYEFRVDLSVHLCLTNVTRFQRMHEEFKTANQPLSYLESQRDKYLQSFKNYCKGASSVKIFVDFLCKHITPEVLKAANEKLCQQIADDMKFNNPALNGNRSNLENHILQHLATQENFKMYEEYLDFPKRYFDRFIQEKVDTYRCDTRNLDAIHQEHLQAMKNQILTASTAVTIEVDEKAGNAHMWLDWFCRNIGHLITIKRDELHCIENEDIGDWQFFKDMMAKSLEEMIKDEKLDVEAVREKPTKNLLQHFEGCWAQCPFCQAVCTNTIPDHDGKHSVKFHRCEALTGCFYDDTDHFSVDFCTTSVNSDKSFFAHTKNKWIHFKTYTDAGDPFDKWSITADGTGQRYWKWFICRFQKEWENRYGFKFRGRGSIPNEWTTITKQSALEELK
ncbi:interferon-induced very large GTPase 1-like [Alosa sapidissima]|uniref:interferon-induced very large GTPase 1-like n=1 Tax=Alosa sapidissima TaxID=34773 RepID=UPI001C0A1DD9|nr:interferon-induced very large GTPase 1-like [Alosa sapidissima]